MLKAERLDYYYYVFVLKKSVHRQILFVIFFFFLSFLILNCIEHRVLFTHLIQSYKCLGRQKQTAEHRTDHFSSIQLNVKCVFFIEFFILFCRCHLPSHIHYFSYIIQNVITSDFYIKYTYPKPYIYAMPSWNVNIRTEKKKLYDKWTATSMCTLKCYKVISVFV